MTFLFRTLVLASVLIGLSAATAEPAAADKLTAAARLSHAVLDAEDHRRAADPAIAEALASRLPALRSQAVLALGRIGEPASVALVTPVLKDEISAVRANAAFALGLLGGAEALEALHAAEALDTEVASSAQVYLALGRAGTAAELDALAHGLNKADQPEVQAAAAEGLGLLFNHSDATLVVAPETIEQLSAAAQAPADGAVDAAFALARYPAAWTNDQKADATAAFQNAANPEAKALLARVMAKIKDAAARDALLGEQAATDLGLRTEVARALGALPADTLTLAALSTFLHDGEAQVAEQALESIRRLGVAAASLADDVRTLATDSESAWLKDSALQTLPALDQAMARPVLEAQLTDGASSQDLAAALRGLAGLGDGDALNKILPYLTSANLTVASAATEGVGSFGDDLLNQSAKEALRSTLARHDLALTATVAEVAGRLVWKDFAPALAEAYAAFVKPDDVEGKMAVLDALGKVGDATYLPLLEGALTDDSRQVGLAAAAAYQAISGTDVSGRVPAVSTVRAVTPSAFQIRRAVAAKVRLETTRGIVVFKMLPDAPLVAYNFVKLAKAGFYDGKTFHRIVPHFVAQGGDPRGDGYGGPGYLIRDAVSPLSHRRGLVGMATAGKDTAGSQFFIDHAPNLHLDGAYTIFARTVRGMDVVDQLQQGDRVLKVSVLE